MAYTNIDDPSAHFQSVLWTGNNSHPRTITNDGNSDLQPDWIWVKQRTTSTNHFLYDSSRTFNANGELASNETGAEGSFDNNLYGYISAATSDGFTVSSGTTNGDDFNQSSREYVAWQWKANSGTTSSNTDGTISSTVQVNSDAGFSIQTLTSASSGTSNWGHGLGQKPDWWVVKITGSGGGGWWLHHKSLTSGASSHYLGLHSTQAAGGLSAFDANSSTITASADFVANSKTCVCYAFIEKQGYSKFGKYVGNGSTDGPFIYTGFKPAFVMIKRRDSGTTYSSWSIYDDKRLGYNPTGGMQVLYANRNYAEGKRGQGSDNTGVTAVIDMLSNGFKIRDADSDEVGAPNNTYIYMAFAEHPFVTSTGIPTTAR